MFKQKNNVIKTCILVRKWIYKYFILGQPSQTLIVYMFLEHIVQDIGMPLNSS